MKKIMLRTRMPLLCLVLCIFLAACTNSFPARDADNEGSSDSLSPSSSTPGDSSESTQWFADALAVKAEDLQDIEYIAACRQNPLPGYIYMSKSGRSAAIAFTDGRVIDFGHYGGEIAGGVIVSFDGRLVCRPSAPLEAYQETDYPPYSVLHASLNGGPLGLVTKDYTQFTVLEHKKLIFYIRNTVGDSGLFSWAEGNETPLFADANQFVCSANGAYVLARGEKSVYIITMDSQTVVEILGIESVPKDIRPLAVSNDGRYFYYEYGMETKKDTLLVRS